MDTETVCQASTDGAEDKPNLPELSSISEEELREEMQELMDVLPTIINDVTEDLDEIEDTRKWIVDLFSYNLSTGNKDYAITVVLCYKMLVGKANCSPEKLFLARILSWCVHMVTTWLLMADDVMDQSTLRRGNGCWYRKEQVGMVAINDICFIQTSVHYIVKKYFSNCDYYSGILDTFSEALREALLGQYLDVHRDLLKKPKLQHFTLKKYETIAKIKASFLLILTTSLALYLADYDKEVVKHPVIEDILRKIGVWIQHQNDFLDCFGDFAASGKSNGDDIQNGRCTWLITKAIEKASEAQLELLEDNYGVKDRSCVLKVMNVYKELRLEELYLEHEDHVYKEIVYEAQQLSNNEMLSFLQPLISNFAKQVYERKYSSL